ncbi:hypothetical protein Tco_0038579 [Tanacetum coccineum]
MTKGGYECVLKARKLDMKGVMEVLARLLGDVMVRSWRHYKLWILVGASFTQGTVSSIPIVGSISPEGFLPPILLLVVNIVTVVIVALILVVVVVAIVGVVIVVAIIRVVVVVGGVSFIIKLLFVIIGFEAVTFPSILLGNPQMKASKSFSGFGTMFGHKTANS